MLTTKRSISRRLTVWFSSVFFAGLVFFGALMWFDLSAALTSGRSHTLEKRASRLGELLRTTRSLPPAQCAARFQAFANATGGGLIEVFDVKGRRIFPSPSSAAKAFPWPEIRPVDRDTFGEVDVSGEGYRILMRPSFESSTPLILCVASPLASNRALLDAFSAGLVWTIPVLLALSALGGYALSRKALAPVDRITEATRSISASNLAERLPVPNTGDELERLSHTCNAMLARLESAVQEIKQFTADASHELRSPLSFIRTVAELGLRNGQADAASREAFREIVDECGKAGRLLQDMLTLARADAGSSNLTFESIDLAEVVSEVCDKARLLAEERHLTIAVSFSDERIGTIWGEYSSIHRLLSILVDNAIKYTPAPGAIHVGLGTVAGKMTVTVQDDGVGISRADLPHIFGRFYRADPSRGQVEGFGLGLAIAKWIAEIHNARLCVESQEGVGSVFRIEFPALAVSTARPAISLDVTFDQAAELSGSRRGCAGLGNSP